ncbi:hypothetical protein [uncultured Metabacillus sp.]|uniref:hypothetical protein n=1 Tax=uncultured Metabacillus sp. TaxID=2860135 RepID=UPI002636F7EE|nr:hypothetical protein [uncultured Metabacillus sp.]
MGMYENVNDIVKKFYHDDHLLRLLYYPPTNYSTILDPLDPSLENVIDIDEEWSIRDERILLVPKTNDLEDNPLCRVYLYAGRRTPTGNYQVAKQEIIVDIVCHSDFEKDLRSMRISDRINELLFNERITGVGKIDYVGGGQISVPSNYVGYSHRYVFGSTKS